MPGVRAGSPFGGWVKAALLTTQEVVVGGWTPGHGRGAGMIGALLLGAHDGQGRLPTSPCAGLATELGPLAQSGSEFDDVIAAVKARAARWVCPVLVCEVVYRTLTPDLRLRHAAWRGLRPDGDPTEVSLGR